MFHQFDEDELLDTFHTRSELHKTVQQSCTNTLTEMPTLPENLRKAEARLRESCSGKAPENSGKAAKSSTTLHRELNRKLSSKTPTNLPQTS